MPAWFSKVFKESVDDAVKTVSDTVRSATKETPVEVEEESFKPRKVINAPVLVDDETPNEGTGIRIKAKADPYGGSITLLVDRPLLEGHSVWCPDKDTAYSQAPLAGALFDAGSVSSVLIHGMTVTVTRNATATGPWEDAAAAYGAIVREHLESGKHVVLPEWRDQMPPSEEIRSALQQVIDEEINPGIASHSGVITLTRVEGNTAYILMGGGCQGCAASTITLRQGVESAFREACPWLGALLDETDHEAGQNPYFRELPTGMGG